MLSCEWQSVASSAIARKVTPVCLQQTFGKCEDERLSRRPNIERRSGAGVSFRFETMELGGVHLPLIMCLCVYVCKILNHHACVSQIMTGGNGTEEQKPSGRCLRLG
ncbi:hypothetical protein ZHAS_00016392 [Anopheles sinensis]|uniref:Uncharacterized protein n=1 Tax=Anopheles sinensis TaxID=74873 RepID=A0A084WDH3_ANOSI|nr:hypothetical protein ZHAS_00016392 [Anopheles sinensis]